MIQITIRFKQAHLPRVQTFEDKNKTGALQYLMECLHKVNFDFHPETEITCNNGDSYNCPDYIVTVENL